MLSIMKGHVAQMYYVKFKRTVTIIITVKKPDGSVLANTNVTVNGSTKTTNSSGQISLSGNYGDTIQYNFVVSGYASKNLNLTFGVDGNQTINLTSIFTLTITRYETRWQTLTTIINGTSYSNEQTLQVAAGTSIRVVSGGNWSYTGFIIVNGSSSNKTDYTFTMPAQNTTVTTTQPYDVSTGSGGEGSGGEGG